MSDRDSNSKRDDQSLNNSRNMGEGLSASRDLNSSNPNRPAGYGRGGGQSANKRASKVVVEDDAPKINEE